MNLHFILYNNNLFSFYDVLDPARPRHNFGKEIEKEINKQINRELFAHYTYMSMVSF